MKKLFTLIFFIAFITIKGQEGSTQDWSNEDQKTFESATDLFNKRYYELAYAKYVSLQPNHPDDLFLKFVRGVCAVYVNNKHKEAEKLLLEVKKNNANAENIDYYLALLYHKSYRFDKALEIIAGLLSNPGISKEDRNDLERIAFFSRNGKKEIQYPFETMIESMGPVVNTEYAEYAPVISPEEEAIIFTYRGKGSTGGLVNANNKPDPNGDYNEDIFISKKVDGVWQQPTGITELNTAGNDAAIALSPDGKYLFIFKSTGDNGDIYVSKREGGKYLSSEKLPGEVNSEYWEGSVSVSTDQQKLYFSSNRPGGFGGNDLYVATKKDDGTWGNVKNLGSKINTEYDEDAPFISPDSRTLIFSSEGHNSIGDFDLFFSNLNLADGSWMEPKNLGYPVNTTDDDLFYVLSADGKRGYFSSAREGGKGDQDLYVVEPALASRKNYITTIKGKVTENKLPFETEILVGVAGESKNYGTYKSSATSGNYVINLPTGRNYKLSFLHPVLGEKIYTIYTEQVEDYAEKTINVNFNAKETSKLPVAVVVTKADSAVKAFAIGGIAAKTNDAAGKNQIATQESKTKETNNGLVVTKEQKTNNINEKTEVNPVPLNKKTKTKRTNNDLATTKEQHSDNSAGENTKENKVAANTNKTKSAEKNIVTPESDENKITKAEKITTAAASDKKDNNCGKIRKSHDADFIYRKCNSVWYTKSKSRPYSSYAKGFFMEWTSLADNTKANERLDKRYPKD